MNRREFLQGLAVASLMAAGGCLSAARRRGFRVALNASTIRAFNLSFLEQVRVAVAAGYDGYEPWLKDLHAAKVDGTLRTACDVARAGGLQFVNGIAFGSWVHPDAAIRAAGLDETKRDMALLAEIGCPRVAASMFGVQMPGSPHVTTEEIAARYVAVLDLGQRAGVRPLLEYWGHSVNLHTPAQALDVIRRVKRPDAAVLADVYHTYRGGGDIRTLARFSADELPVVHVNDYPADKPRTTLTDADRVWPGDGAADWTTFFATLDAIGAKPWLSLELFNESYQRNTPLDTAQTGVAKVRGLKNRGV